MANEEARQQPLTQLPRIEDLPRRGEGLDPDGVHDAFEAYRRHAAQLQAQLRVLQAAGRSTQVEPTGHAVRMDSLHLIRAAAEFADTVERDAQTASAAQLARTEEEVRTRQRELQAREADVERYRADSERQRNEILNATKQEQREILTKENADANTELREAEVHATRLLEQARHQATELTNAARAEVEQTLEWARAQGTAIMARAQHGAEQLLGAAGLGDDAVGEVASAIVRATEQSVEPRDRPTVPPVAALAGGADQEEEEPEAPSEEPPAATGRSEPDEAQE
jgi:F0F1-type ATP synthase membrane subunit b/b'